MLGRLHVLVVGPGLGRDPLMHKTLAKVLAAARERKMPVVMDADALGLVQTNPELVIGWKEVVLTPNVVEFGRLQKALKMKDSDVEQESETAKVEALSRALGGVAILQKGPRDFISNGDETLVVDLQGGLKRSGGQGDTLTGSIATFLAWRNAYLEGLWDHGGKLDEKEMLRLAAFGGAAITRVSNDDLHCVVSLFTVPFPLFLYIISGRIRSPLKKQTCTNAFFHRNVRDVRS